MDPASIANEALLTTPPAVLAPSVTTELLPMVATRMIVDPTVFQGSREQKLDAYRDVRDGLIKRIKQRLQS